MKYRIVPVTPFEQNACVIWCEDTMEGAITDPGGDLPRLLDAVKEEGVTLTKILLTHGHIDHVGYTKALAEQTDLPIIGPHPDDDFLLTTLDQFAGMTMLTHSGEFSPDQWLSDGDTVKLGNLKLDVVHCPGHTPGHIVFISQASKLAIVGDVLFQGSIGRTDFPRGNHADLINSIKAKLLPLGDDIQFIPGHGPISTFGQERLHNPFLL